MPSARPGVPAEGESSAATRGAEVLDAPRLDVRGYTCCVMVPLGSLLPRLSGTKRPVEAERVTVRLLPVPEPTRSVVVFPGHRAAAARETKRPLDALRLTERAIAAPPSRFTPGRRALASVRRPTTPATIEAQHLVGLRVDLGVTGRACLNRFAPFEVRLPGALTRLYMLRARKPPAISGGLLVLGLPLSLTRGFAR